MTTPRAKLTEPLETVTAFFATFPLLVLVAGTVLTLTGRGALGGFGHTDICVTQPNTGYGGENWASYLGTGRLPPSRSTAPCRPTRSIPGSSSGCPHHRARRPAAGAICSPWA
jgi:hypothetical protein